jgi:hypothetical protein
MLAPLLVERSNCPEARGRHGRSIARAPVLPDDAEGEPLEVLWEKEIDARRMSGSPS